MVGVRETRTAAAGLDMDKDMPSRLATEEAQLLVVDPAPQPTADLFCAVLASAVVGQEEMPEGRREGPSSRTAEDLALVSVSAVETDKRGPSAAYDTVDSRVEAAIMEPR